MSAELDKIRDTFSDQLASFDIQLQASANDVEMLTDIQEGISSLLASSPGNEAEIRQVLQERYDAGSLRKETFQLVKSVLDHYRSANDPAGPGLGEPATLHGDTSPSILDEINDEVGDDKFGTTTVIPQDVASSATADSRVQVGSLLRDRFLLQERVSGGSMGVVYKALDRRLAEADAPEPWVAIKVLSPQLAENAQALRALQQEAAKGRCLIHPNIVRFIDLDRDDDLYFLVMEWLEGRTLASILDSADAKMIDHDTAFRIVEQIGGALEYAHRCGIVHADVKPNNIMLMPNGDAKLFDFGVARVCQSQNRPDFDPGVLGAVTPAYSSMQVLTGDEPVASDDVFSLACLLYRLLAGHRVFGPRNAAEASQEGMTPLRPQGVSDSQWRALKKALSYARVMRYASVDKFIDALRQHDDDTVAVAPPDVAATGEERASGWRVAAVAALLALFGGVIYQFGYLDPWLKWAENVSDSRAAREQAESVLPPVDEVADGVESDEAALEPAVNPPGTAIELRRTPSVAESSREPLVDFSKLPPATIEVPFTPGVLASTNFKTRLREDGRPVIVDFIRSGGVGTPLILKLEEVGFSGNRSPWGSGQYAFSNGGIVRFPVGQDRSRITLSMASDSVREADQVSTLRLRDVDSAESELAAIYVTLEDDDQRAFEAQLPENTIAFAASETSVRESAPAVQIELARFNPDETRVVAGYIVTDVTATEGEDYFAPGNYSVIFGPGQRSARLLIPLVRDSLLEGEETFIIRLALPYEAAVDGVYQHIVIRILDDEPQSP